MTLGLSLFYFLLAFGICAASFAMACIAFIRFVRIYPAWSTAVESTTSNTWLSQAARLSQGSDWAHPGGALVIFVLGLIFGIAGAEQIFFGGFAETASYWLESSPFFLIFSFFNWSIFPFGAAMAVYNLGKAAAPSTSPIRLAMAEFDANSRLRDIAQSEHSTLELDIAEPPRAKRWTGGPPRL